MTSITRILPALVSSCLLACDGEPASLTPGPDAGVELIDGGRTTVPDAGPRCEPNADIEEACGNGRDEDCDGRTDCLDSDCTGAMCGGEGFVCLAGGCVREDFPLPELPPILIRDVRVRGGTAAVDFQGVEGALDYRVYSLPEEEDVRVGEDGVVVVRDAVYRCSGGRPVSSTDASLTGDLDFLFTRRESESLLGYVYLEPGAGRLPVYRLADPRPDAASHSQEAAFEYRNGTYTTREAERARLLSEGWRDDGVQFYAPAPNADTAVVYEWESTPRSYKQNRRLTVVHVEGAEHSALAASDMTAHHEERFHVHRTQLEGSVALHRIHYAGGHDHDVLAAGPVQLARALHQGATPVTTVSWPALSGPTTLVIEALDAGCPFLGHIAPRAMPAEGYAEPWITLDDARLDAGEVFLNGQHDPANRPRPIARAYVDVAPEAAGEMDFSATFDPGSSWSELPLVDEGWGWMHYRNDEWDVSFNGAEPGHHVGLLHGELVAAFADIGADVNGRFRISPRVDASIERDRFLHVRFDTDLWSTGRRYSQVLISSGSAPIDRNLCGSTTLVFEPIASPAGGGAVDLQLQLCDDRPWDVNAQCPRAVLANHEDGDYFGDEPWSPQPVAAEYTGFDQRARLEVYASTERVYAFLEGRPVGCVDMPTGSMPSGPVSVSFGAVLYHSGVDESVVSGDAHRFLRDYELTQTRRHFDNLGIDTAAAEPAWDETLFPCSRGFFYGDEASCE